MAKVQPPQPGGRGEVEPASDTLSTWDVRAPRGVLVVTGHPLGREASIPSLSPIFCFWWAKEVIWPLLLSTDKFLGPEVFHCPWLEHTVNTSTLVFVTRLTKEGKSHLKFHQSHLWEHANKEALAFQNKQDQLSWGGSRPDLQPLKESGLCLARVF